MNRLNSFAVLLLLTVSSSVFAQKPIISRSNLYLSGLASFASGKYAKSIEKTNFSTQSFGGVFGYVYNPWKKNDLTFPVSVGGEFGIVALGSGRVENRTSISEFRSSNTSYWLNVVARYRPIYWTNIVSPFVDLAFGPKIISTGVYEQFNEEEYDRLTGKTNVVFNTTLGAGIGVKMPNPEGNTVYFDVGIYYQQTNPTRIVERNSVIVFSRNDIDFREQVTPLNNAQIRVGLTWFR